MKIDVVKLIKKFEGKIPQKYIDEDVSLVQASESAIALENLCMQIGDHELKISADLYEEIKALCLFFGSNYYEDIFDQVAGT